MRTDDEFESFEVRRTINFGWVLEILCASALFLYFSVIVLLMLMEFGAHMNVPGFLLFAILLSLWALTATVIVRNIKSLHVDGEGISCRIFGLEYALIGWEDIVQVKSEQTVTATFALITSTRRDASFRDHRGQWRKWDRHWSNGERLWKQINKHINPQYAVEMEQRISRAQAIESKRDKRFAREKQSLTNGKSAIPEANDNSVRQVYPNYDTSRDKRAALLVPAEGMIFPQVCCRCLVSTTNTISLVLSQHGLIHSTGAHVRSTTMQVPCCRSCTNRLESKDGKALVNILGLIVSATMALMALFLAWGSLNPGWLFVIFGSAGVVWAFRRILTEETLSMWVRVHNYDRHRDVVLLAFGNRKFLKMVKHVIYSS